MREPASKKTVREDVIRVASELFRENGIKSITMDDIAAKLSMSKRTLYEKFTDKESLLKECILERHREMNEYIKGLDSSMNVLEILLSCHLKALEDFRRTNTLFFQDLKKYPNLIKLLRQNRNDESEGANVYYQMGIEQGLFRDDVNFEIMTLLFHEQLNVVFDEEGLRKYSYEEIYEVILLSFIRGVCTEKGLKLLEDYIREYRKEREFLPSVRLRGE